MQGCNGTKRREDAGRSGLGCRRERRSVLTSFALAAVWISEQKNAFCRKTPFLPELDSPIARAVGRMVLRHTCGSRFDWPHA